MRPGPTAPVGFSLRRAGTLNVRSAFDGLLTERLGARRFALATHGSGFHGSPPASAALGGVRAIDPARGRVEVVLAGNEQLTPRVGVNLLRARGLGRERADDAHQADDETTHAHDRRGRR